MRRVAVIGCGGAEKTTLSRELGRLLDLPVSHIDVFYWRGDDEGPSDEWPQVHHELVSRDRWIIDGMKPGVLPERLERADTVIFLDLPRVDVSLGGSRGGASRSAVARIPISAYTTRSAGRSSAGSGASVAATDRASWRCSTAARAMSWCQAPAARAPLPHSVHAGNA